MYSNQNPRTTPMDQPTGDTYATTRHTIVGTFATADHASQAISDLRDAGFRPDQVSVVARDSRGNEELARQAGETVTEKHGNHAPEGAGTGAVLGGLTGGVLGWLVGIGALAIPGIGPVVTAGVLGSAIAAAAGGAAVGAVTGGLIGAFVGMGIPEDEAKHYEDRVRSGRILLAAIPATEMQERQAFEIFNRHGGEDIRTYNSMADADSGVNRLPNENPKY